MKIFNPPPEASSSRLRLDSFQKFATASQTLEFEKQSSFRSLSYNVAAVVYCKERI
ncbi:MAG: hypothetical protein SOZ96_08665 [Treponema sp.]|nr:hypothetical protein [Treponema sp.]